MTEAVHLIGILDDGWAGLGDAARAALQRAGCVIGAGRTLELVAGHLAADCRVFNMDGALGRVPAEIARARSEGRAVAVLATGDPLCHGIAPWLAGRLGAEALRVLPAPSTVQLACARLQLPWQDLRIASCHGPDAGEWSEGAGPEHGLYPALRAIARHPQVMLFTSPANDPPRIARALLTLGYGDELRLAVLARLAQPQEEISTGLTLAQVAAGAYPQPNLLLVQRRDEDTRALFGFADSDYIQRSPEKGLITKLEVRALSLARLALQPHSTVWDIGAGSGSVGLEAARIASHGHVWAIEKNAADAANARANARRLRAGNYSLREGRAPEGLDAWPDPDAVFIGGSGGELAELIRRVLARLRPGGRLVMNFVTLENLATATTTLAALGAGWDVTQLSAARSQPILDMHRLAAQNPVWVVTAWRDTPAAEKPADD